jgi:hypothetical protein
MKALLATAACFLALTAAGGAVGAADRSGTRVQALPSSGKVGEPIRLRVWAKTDARALCFSASIYSGGRHPIVVSTPFVRAVPAPRLRWYYVVWSKPPPTRGTYPFCIKAFDRTGKQSNLDCAPVRVR